MAKMVSPEHAKALAPSQLKLCPYDEEEPAIWFCLIEAQFAVVGIKSKKNLVCKRSCQLAQTGLPGHFRHSLRLQ
jgi:hypothetical protein